MESYKQGKAYFERGNYEKAEALLTQALSDHPAFADIHCLLGMVKHDRGEFGKAIGHFRKALEINPDYAEARLNLMITYNDLGKYKESQALLPWVRAEVAEHAESRDPITLNKIANAHAYTAELYMAINNNAGAIRELERAVEIRPNFADLRARLGVAYRQAGRSDDSVVQLVEALKVNPNYTYARIQLGISYLEAGEKQEAVRQWDLVLSVDPKNQIARTYKHLAEAKNQPA